MTLFNFGLKPNDICRHKDHINYGYALILEIGYYGKQYKIAKCEWTTSKNDSMGLIKHIRLNKLIKEVVNDGRDN